MLHHIYLPRFWPQGQECTWKSESLMLEVLQHPGSESPAKKL